MAKYGTKYFFMSHNWIWCSLQRRFLKACVWHVESPCRHVETTCRQKHPIDAATLSSMFLRLSSLPYTFVWNLGILQALETWHARQHNTSSLIKIYSVFEIMKWSVLFVCTEEERYGRHYWWPGHLHVCHLQCPFRDKARGHQSPFGHKVASWDLKDLASTSPTHRCYFFPAS